VSYFRQALRQHLFPNPMPEDEGENRRDLMEEPLWKKGKKEREAAKAQPEPWPESPERPEGEPDPGDDVPESPPEPNPYAVAEPSGAIPYYARPSLESEVQMTTGQQLFTDAPVEAPSLPPVQASAVPRLDGTRFVAGPGNLVVRPFPERTHTDGGLEIPENARERQRFGVVLSSSTPRMRPGDTVGYSRHAGHDIDTATGTVCILRKDEVLVTLWRPWWKRLFGR
jgi:co-chaperonin GroES (HSP10)